MPADYQVLADVYDSIGLGEFAEVMTPRLLDFALQRDWLGRQITSLGCGQGAGLAWPIKHNYVVTGVDNSPEMLKAAQAALSSQGLRATWQQDDIRSLNRPDSADMALALSTLNEMDSTREWESVFKSVHQMLRANKWFVFDMLTIEGLFALNEGDLLIHEDNETTIFAQNQFDFDRQIQSRRYLIFTQQADAGWQRREATRILRAYPVQAVTALLQRSGFAVLHVLNPDLSSYDPNKAGVYRVIIMAQKR